MTSFHQGEGSSGVIGVGFLVLLHHYVTTSSVLGRAKGAEHYPLCSPYRAAC